MSHQNTFKEMKQEFENDYLDCDARDLAEIGIKSIKPQNVSDFEQEMIATYGDSIQQMNRIYKVNPSVVNMVDSPPHYNKGGIETIEYMKAYSTPEEFQGHLRLTTLKYLSRLHTKDEPLENAKKARWYLNKLIEELQQ